MEKLSELSKPVAEIVSKFGDPEAFGEREIKLLTGIQQMAYGTKFYSQEYVSALLERIAELEGQLNEMTAFRDNAVKKNARRWEEILELRAKLATPVRLLGEMLPHEWERAERQSAFEHRKIAWDARLAEDKKAILAAGFTFTVEGDE